MNPDSTHLSRWIHRWIEKDATGSELNSSCEWCYQTFVLHACTIRQQRGLYTHGQSVHWACQSGYWVSIGVTEFSSTCNEGSFSPPLEHCTEKPRCPALTVQQNGSTNSHQFICSIHLFNVQFICSIHLFNVQFICSIHLFLGSAFFSLPLKLNF